MSYRVSLTDLVLQLISGGLSVPQFRDRYYDFYLEEVPDDVMSDRDYEFFGKLHEKLDWTGPCPSHEERSWGWIDYAEYIAWAKEELEKYKADSGE
jgi:hypothetical protein